MQYLFSLSILLSSFLLFQIQPLISKHLLPFFGGSASVWMVAMLVFQSLLLGGYAMAHALSKLSPQRQIHWYISGLIISCLSLFIQNNAWSVPLLPPGNATPDSQAVGIALSILQSTGLPFLILSMSTNILQSWYRAQNPDKSPYFLYSYSNIGSLAGLLTYPLIFEPLIGLTSQARVWSITLTLFTVLICYNYYKSKKSADLSAQTSSARKAHNKPSPSKKAVAHWFLLSFSTGCALLATTNKITSEIGCNSLFWVTPLAIFLISFVLAFQSKPIPDKLCLLGSALFMPMIFIGSGGSIFDIAPLLMILFFVTTLCHRTLYDQRPVAEHLTLFYLWISIGGVVSALCVSIVCPLVFNDIYEYPLSLLLGFGLIVGSRQKHWPRKISLSSIMTRQPLLALTLSAVFLIALPRTIGHQFTTHTYEVLYIFLLAFLLLKNIPARDLAEKIRSFCTVFIPSCLIFSFFIPIKGNLVTLESQRNFYGVSKVCLDLKNSLKVLLHCKTIHGISKTDGSNDDTFSYYGINSGFGKALTLQKDLHPEGVKIGIIGLGAGLASVYTRPQDHVTYYEIDPIMVHYSGLQGAHFQNITNSQSPHKITLGDARVSLQSELKEKSKGYDLMMLDAFSGDSIPYHLITKESFALYAQHLDPSGILAFHISNRYFDLEPQILLQAEILNMRVHIHHDHVSHWILMTQNAELKKPLTFTAIADLENKPPPLSQAWTDNYYNPMSALVLRFSDPAEDEQIVAPH